MTTASLMDLLALLTQICTQHIAHRNFDSEYEEARDTVLHIQGILESRQKIEKIPAPESTANRDEASLPRPVRNILNARLMEKLKQEILKPRHTKPWSPKKKLK
ncbi:MAG TPA: hypothetical protein VF476_14760 [Chitinophagaceae bacterium]